MEQKKSTGLTYNRKNAVTHSIERITFDGRPAIRKILNSQNTADTPPEWHASEFLEHWNYWARESLVYQSDLQQALNGTGVRLPNVLHIAEHGPHIELVLEEIHGRCGTQLSPTDYPKIAFAWGKAQAQLSNSHWESPWMSRRFLHEYTASKPVDYQVLHERTAWARPLIANNWPASLQDKLIAFYENRKALLAIVDCAPSAPCHLDFWPNNVFIDTQANVVPIDWAFFGEGALGEDIANFIPDAVFDDFVSPALLPKMESEVFAAYREGLTQGGLDPDKNELQKTFYACAVKYVWLAPLLLERAASEVQTTYGDMELSNANAQYRRRGQTLSHLCDWANLALGL